MAKKVELDNTDAVQKLRELIALAQQLMTTLQSAGQSLSGLGGAEGNGAGRQTASGIPQLFANSAGPGPNAALGSVGMNGQTATLSTPQNQGSGLAGGAGGSPILGGAQTGQGIFQGMQLQGFRDPSFGSFPGALPGGPGGAAPSGGAQSSGGSGAFGGGGIGSGGAGATIMPLNGGGGGGNVISQYIGFRTIREFGRGIAETTNDVANYQASGQVNPMGLGQGAGNIAGAGIAIAMLAGGAALGPAGIAGMVASPIIGAGIDLAMAPATARFNTANQFAGFAGASGQSASFLASNAQQIANQSNEDFDQQRRQRENPFSAFFDKIMRGMGKYPGTDQTNTQAVGQIESSIGGAYLERGITLTPDELRRKSQPYIDRGLPGVEQAAIGSRAIRDYAYTGENYLDSAERVGIDAVATDLNSRQKFAARIDTTRAFGALQALNGQSERLGYDIAGAEAKQQSVYFSGANFSERQRAFDDTQARLKALVPVQQEAVRIASLGGDGIQAAKARKELQETQSSIAQNPNQFTTQEIGILESQNQARMAQAQQSVSVAALTGDPQDILKAGSVMQTAIRENLARVRQEQALPNQRPEQIEEARRRATELSTLSVSNPFTQSGAALKRTNLIQDAEVSTFQADITSASFFGSDSELLGVTGKASSAQTFIANVAQRRSTDLSLEFEDRKAETFRAAQARQNALTLRAAGVQMVFGRISGRAAAQEQGAENAFTIAGAYGSLEDIGTAGAGIGAALADEKQKILGLRSQMNADQQIAADRRVAAIEGQQIQAVIGARQETIGRVAGTTGVGVGQALNAFQNSTAFGSDASIGTSGAVALGALNNQRDQLLGQRNLPGTTVQQQVQIDNMVNQINSQTRELQIGIRGEEVGRVEGRAGLGNQAAANVLGRAAYGTGDDVRGASAGLIRSLGDESGKLQEQINKGGLTFDQEAKIKSRMLEISNQQFQIGQSAIDQGFAKDDMAGFGIRQTQLRTRQQINNILPFGYGDRLSTDIGVIRNDQQQLGVLAGREAQLRQGGNLSPERAYEIAQQRSGLQIEIAQSEAGLSSHMEDMLPAMSAGTPASFRMFNSSQLAALSYFRRGSPVRDSGAINGRHAQMQHDWFNDIGGGSVPEMFPSRTSGINNAGSDARLTGAIERLTVVIESDRLGGRAGSAQRLGDSVGQSSGMLSQRDVGVGYNGRKF